ncbi:MAG: tyrosine-type recombinase/integrase [Thermincola sp.]|jgi:site-specific recombinase XerD|nr:tyrosine-type recombinase/integrase [Thermincola sp.]MDT3701974.1 tyrosine-type recombinase/integrase [Thermincola sp.]
MSLNFEEDIWLLPSGNKSLAHNLSFNFTHIKSNTLKAQIKEYFRRNLNTDSLSIDTLNRYCYGLRHFSNFMREHGIVLESFRHLTFDICIKYAFYLKNTVKTSTGKKLTGRTANTSYAGLKSIVLQGQVFQPEDYPQSDVFPEKNSRMFGVDDAFETEEIPEFVIKQIEEALKNESDVVTKTFLMIAKDTGLRISEILFTEEECLEQDFIGDPLMWTYSSKNCKGRLIPIRKSLEKQIRKLLEWSAQYRDSDERRIFWYEACKKSGPKGEVKVLSQDKVRKGLIPNFVKRHRITDEIGNLYFFHPHQFRHTAARDILDEGGSILDVQEFLGQDSPHSASIYGKMRANSVIEDYRKIGFIGDVAQCLSEKSLGLPVTDETVAEGALPDGHCRKAFEGEKSCKNFNKCLLCAKFITTLDYLNVHKQHLARLQENKTAYMAETCICNLEKVERIEGALIDIIQRLEGMK